MVTRSPDSKPALNVASGDQPRTSGNSSGRTARDAGRSVTIGTVPAGQKHRDGALYRYKIVK